MFYKIIEISTAKAAKETYLLVHFWEDEKASDSEPPVLINDFIMALRPDSDVPATIAENIEGYWERAERHGWRGDHSSADGRLDREFTEKAQTVRRAGQLVVAPIVRNKTDPHGVLALPDVVALKPQAVKS